MRTSRDIVNKIHEGSVNGVMSCKKNKHNTGSNCVWDFFLPSQLQELAAVF